MAAEPEQVGERTVELKDPGLAAFLAWLIPGLGHLYQGRTAKAILFFVCILGTFAYGVYLGGRSDLGYGRAVYLSFRTGDNRLPFLCQVGVGLPALPAVIQANLVRQGKPPLWNGFMAPPRLDGEGNLGLRNSPSLDTLHYELSTRFELATVYTMIAGLLNILAIYDAWGGPVWVARKEEEEEEDEKSKKDRPPKGEGKTPQAPSDAGKSADASSHTA